MHFLQVKFFGLILLQFSLVKNELLRQLHTFQQEDGIRNGIVAASIVNTGTGQSVLSYNDHFAVNSASTLKLVTTAAAISSLGPQYSFETSLGYTGNLSNGRLEGNLVIIPSGDPSLGSERGSYTFFRLLEVFSQAVHQAGIRQISGKILIQDEARFRPEVPDSWTWGDLGNYYGAIPRSFNINENLYTVYFNAGNKLGESATIGELVPFKDSWKIVNEVKTGAAGSGDQVYIYSTPLSETLRMTGTIPLGSKNFAVKGSIPDPAGLFAFYLRNTLQVQGVSISEDDEPVFPEELNFDPKTVQRLSGVWSLPLIDLATLCNHHSINLYADAFLIKLSGSGFKESGKFLRDFWKSRNLSLEGFQPKDGSGLSPSGYLTARNMTDILTSMSRDSRFSSFLETIPVVGKDGSVKFKDPKNQTRGRLRAKSGSIESTRAYAGYFNDKTGEQYSFMVCVNHYDPGSSLKVRRFLDNFLIDMAKN